MLLLLHLKTYILEISGSGTRAKFTLTSGIVKW